MYSVEDNLRIYCAMWPDRARALIALSKGQMIHPSTLAAFRSSSNGLVEAYAAVLTPHGKEVVARAQAILNDTFIPASSALDGIVEANLKTMDMRGLYRLEACRAHNLMAVHLKALRSVVLRPGQAYNGLEMTYGRLVLTELTKADFLKTGERRKCDQIWPTAKADALMAFLSGQVFAAQVMTAMPMA